MRKIFVCLVVLSCSLSASGTTHNLFVKDPMFLERQEAYLHNNHRFEIHMGPVVSFGNIKDKKDHSASHQMYGLLGRVDLRIWKGLWIGIEGEKFKTVNLKNTILPELSRKSWSGLIKLNITNNTQPYLYLIGGVGEFWEEGNGAFSYLTRLPCRSFA